MARIWSKVGVSQSALCADTAGMDVTDDEVEVFERHRWLPPSLHALARAALDLILPPHCPGCGVRTLEPAALCPTCWAGLAFIERPFCERTATPFSLDLGPDMVSPEALQHPPRFDRARAAVLYQGLAPELVHKLKYGDRHELVPLLARLMARRGADILTEADVLVPVPLHRGRLWQRRFNQAALLAGAVGRIAHRPVAMRVLERRKPTPAQVGLTREARARNVAGAFVVPGRWRWEVEGRAVVLIDDVFTTGATLSAAARVLKKAGAARVDALVFARVAEVIAVA